MADSGVDTSNESSDNPVFELPITLPVNETGQAMSMEFEEPNHHDLIGKIKCSTKSRHCRIKYRFGILNHKLRFATSTNNTELVESLLIGGSDPNCADEYKRRPLHLAACRGYVDVVKILLRHGANPNLTDTLGNTPLHLAACTNHIAVVTELLDAGTDVSSNDKNGRNPIHLAQSKLKIIQKRISMFTDYTDETKNLIEELHTVVNLMLKYAKLKKVDASEIESISQRLEQVSTQTQVDSEVQNLLDSLDSLNLR